MPSIKRNKKRPWMKATPKPKQSGRTIDNQKFYNAKAWRETSKQHRLANPLCEVSLALDKLIDSQLTDHIIPIAQGGDPYDTRNLMAMCHKQHNKKSGKEKHTDILVEWVLNDNGFKIPKERNEIIKVLTGGRS